VIGEDGSLARGEIDSCLSFVDSDSKPQPF
jgi:hypothetical protein